MKQPKFVSTLLTCAAFVLFCSFTAVKNTSKPVISLNGFSEGKIYAEDFINTKGLTVRTKDGQQCELVSFYLYFLSPEKDPVEFRGKDANFKGIVRKAIDSAKRGDQYIFANVVVKCGDEEPQCIEGLTFEIQ